MEEKDLLLFLIKMIKKISDADLKRRFCDKDLLSPKDIIDYFEKLSYFANDRGISTFYFLDNAGQFLSNTFRMYSKNRGKAYKIKNIKVKGFNRDDEGSNLVYQVSCCMNDNEIEEIGNELLLLPPVQIPPLLPYHKGQGKFTTYVQKNLDRVRAGLDKGHLEYSESWRDILSQTEFASDLEKGILFIDDSIASGSTRYALEQIARLFNKNPVFQFGTFSAWEGTSERGLVDIWNTYGRRDLDGMFFPYEDRADLYDYIYGVEKGLCKKTPLKDNLGKRENKEVSELIENIILDNPSNSLTDGDIFRVFRERVFPTNVSNLDFQLYSPCVGIDAHQYRDYIRRTDEFGSRLKINPKLKSVLIKLSPEIDDETIRIWQQRKKYELLEYEEELSK